MDYLTADQILNAVDITYEDVPVPEWGGTVRIRGLTGTERDRYEQSLLGTKGTVSVPKLAGARARLCAWTIVNAAGELEFTDAQVLKLGKKSAAALERVFDASRKLSGLSEEDVEELAGNSEGEPSDGSTSSLRSLSAVERSQSS